MVAAKHLTQVENRISADALNTYRDDLLQTAHTLTALAYSVIPVYGAATPYPGGAKEPITPWRQFQHAIATPDDLRRWRDDPRFGGLALVCGDVSKLVVVDFDDPDILQRFITEHPDLTNTTTVLTAGRDMTHFYYRPPVGANLASFGRKGAVEFIGNGHYVVIPPTRLATGKNYQFRRGTLTTPLELTAAQFNTLQRFILEYVTTSTPPPDVKQYARLAVLPTPAAMVARYERMRQVEPSRNDSLFRTALNLRSSGVTVEQAAAALLPVFVSDTPNKSNESAAAREREGLATVASAYRMRWNAATGAYQDVTDGLPNSVREALLQARDTKTPRVLDALLRGGIAPGMAFYMPDAIQVAARYGLNARTVKDVIYCQMRRGVKGDSVVAGDGLPVTLFTVDANKGANLPVYSTALEHNYVMLVGKFAPQLKRGRKPAKLYRVPTVDEMCAALGVVNSPGDNLPDECLKSAKAYRLALHAALVARRQGERMSRAWLGARLGLKRRSIQDYDSAAGVVATASYDETPITWRNVNRLPGYDELQWVDGFLDIDGERKPPSRQAAAAALNAGKPVVWKVRRANTYRLADDAPEHATSATTPQAPQAAKTIPEPPQNAPERATVRYCGNCGQAVFVEPPPDVCAYCGDMTTWKDTPPRDELVALALELGGVLT